MEIFLLETIDNVGRIGERVHVKPGYARNYLIPKGKAALATPENIVRFEAMRAELEAKADAEVAAAREQADKFEGQVIRIEAQVGAEGKLFGSVTSIDIADACEQIGVPIERSRVRLPDGPLRVVGEHLIELHLHADVHVPLKVVVASNDPAYQAELEAAQAAKEAAVDELEDADSGQPDDAPAASADESEDSDSGEFDDVAAASADEEGDPDSGQSGDAEAAGADEQDGDETEGV